jgi:glycosyltransferase involved in cell wall biosynthesis
MSTYASTQSVSVIIPHFNSSKWIGEAVSSISEGNNRTIAEIVIVDDGSHPDHQHKLKEIEASAPKVRVIWNKENFGGAFARNRAVHETKSGWIFCLDADNLAPSGLVESLLDHALTRNLDATCAEYCVFFDRSPTEPTHAWQYQKTPLKFLDHFSSAYVPSASGNYLYKKDSFNRAGGYPAFSRSLDTWGFGLRQVATGSNLQVTPRTYYLHRYGHDSYWVRESTKPGGLSLLATSLALPFASQMPNRLLRRLLGRRREKWFDQLTTDPIWPASREETGHLIAAPIGIAAFVDLRKQDNRTQS